MKNILYQFIIVLVISFVISYAYSYSRSIDNSYVKANNFGELLFCYVRKPSLVSQQSFISKTGQLFKDDNENEAFKFFYLTVFCQYSVLSSSNREEIFVLEKYNEFKNLALENSKNGYFKLQAIRLYKMFDRNLIIKDKLTDLEQEKYFDIYIYKMIQELAKVYDAQAKELKIDFYSNSVVLDYLIRQAVFKRIYINNGINYESFDPRVFAKKEQNGGIGELSKQYLLDSKDEFEDDNFQEFIKTLRSPNSQ